jgi:acyl-coenzyme A thioesterase PaaI-like protein
MNVVMITARVGQLAALRAGLERQGARVECFVEAPGFLETARSRNWELVVLDGLQVPFKGFVESLLEINASLNVAVITDLDPEAFHEAGEGLGILCSLPPHPGASDVEPLLQKLRAVGGLDPVIEAAQIRLDAMSQKYHPHCVVCGTQHPFGLKVNYRVTGEHAVEGHFDCGPSYQGYANVVHGGIVSSLLDGAMVSCLLAKGVEAYTVDLRVRYRAAVETGVPATIRGEWLRGEGPMHLLQATLEQGGKVCARARAKFFEGKPNQPSQPMPGGAGVRLLLNQARKRLV